MKEIPDGCVRCRVEEQPMDVGWLVTFPDEEMDLFLQVDYDQAEFIADAFDDSGSSLVDRPADWDGRPSRLKGWADVDVDDIRFCPEHWLERAEPIGDKQTRRERYNHA